MLCQDELYEHIYHVNAMQTIKNLNQINSTIDQKSN